MRKILIDLFIHEKDTNGFTDSGLKSQQRTVVAERFNQDSGCRKFVDKKHLQSQLVYHTIFKNSDWVWNKIDNRPDCPGIVYDEYCKAHPGASAFRNKPLLFYTELTHIFLKSTAVGAYASACTNSAVSPAEVRGEGDQKCHCVLD